MTKLNRAWHLKNKMPKNPTAGQRVQWHKEHLKNCACHPLTSKIKQLIEEYDRQT